MRVAMLLLLAWMGCAMAADVVRVNTFPNAKALPFYAGQGFRNLLALRAEIEGGQPGAPEKYVDLSYYDRAIKRLRK